MINPYHECRNTRRYKTVIVLDQRQFTGAGVPLRVLMHGLKQQDLVWFSRTYGFLADDCLVLGVARPDCLDFEKTVDADNAPVHSAVKSDFEIEEYLLTKKVQLALGVISRQVTVRSGDGTEEYAEELDDQETKGVRTRVRVHDDCFFNIEPVEGPTLRSLVQAVLEQHSFYFQREVNWIPVLDEFIQILARSPIVELKSHPGREHLTVAVRPRQRSMMDALLGRYPRYIVDVGDGTARIVKRPSHE